MEHRTNNQPRSKRPLLPRQEHPCSLYPLHPSDTQVLMRIPESSLTLVDRVAVAASSLVIVGSVVWVPLLGRWAWNKLRSVTDEHKRRKYAALALAATILAIAGPHRSPRFGNWLRVRHWKLWKAWLRFIAMEVIADQPRTTAAALSRPPPTPFSREQDPPPPPAFDLKSDQAALAFVPHGVFPFAFAFGVFPHVAQQVFGFFHPVVATATQFFPLVRDILSWCQSIDASRSSVDQALLEGKRIGVVPGGIAEMFEGYPKPNTLPHEEYAVIRKGFLRLALRHNVPIVPVYCFGATKMFHRLHLSWLERLSNALRVSLCILFGVWGLPIPFRQRLSYVIGDPLFPEELSSTMASSSSSSSSSSLHLTNAETEGRRVDELHQRFCDELLRIFDRHKEAYGWGHKTLQLLTR